MVCLTSTTVRNISMDTLQSPRCKLPLTYQKPCLHFCHRNKRDNESPEIRKGHSGQNGTFQARNEGWKLSLFTYNGRISLKKTPSVMLGIKPIFLADEESIQQQKSQTVEFRKYRDGLSWDREHKNRMRVRMKGVTVCTACEVVNIFIERSCSNEWMYMCVSNKSKFIMV